MTAVKMTDGSIPKHLARYALPLLLGNLFQITYNAVDSAIVGRWIGKEALAAVGAASPVMNLVVLGISGLCVGAGVLMSEFFGAGREGELRRELATALLSGLCACALVTVLGVWLAEPLLRLLRVPEDVLPIAAVYLRVVILGAPFTCGYNTLAAAMKSVGDSQTPLKFLVFSSLMNAALDVVLIGVFRLGMVCSAVTTVVAQAVSALLCVGYIARRVPLLRLQRSDWAVDGTLLRRTWAYGGATALQSACQPVGKLLIQSAVNSLGVDAMACFQAVSRMDDYACLPAQSISQACTTLMAQNRGAGKIARVKRGFRCAMLMELGWWPLIGMVTWFLRVPMVRIFIPAGGAEAIASGCAYLGWMALFYLLPCLTNGCQGFFRGMGRMRVTLLGTLIQISLRVLFVYVLVPQMGLPAVAFASAIGWLAMLAVEAPWIAAIWRRMAEKGQQAQG